MLALPEWLWMGFAGVFGAIVGSFLNVCIVRMPKDESVVTPRSHCPNCPHQLQWWENIPILSYVLLKGCCKGCKAKISMQYPFVEILTAAFSMLTWWWFDPLPYAIYFLLFIAPLIVITFIDLKHYIIPDIISLPGIAIGFLVTLLFADDGLRIYLMIDRVLGVLVGGGGLFLIAWSYKKLKKQEGLGGGDIKLIAALGAFFGWKATIFIMMLSSVFGSVVGGLFLVLLKKDLKFAIPFGPFLAGAGICYLFIGRQLIEWYITLF